MFVFLFVFFCIVCGDGFVRANACAIMGAMLHSMLYYIYICGSNGSCMCVAVCVVWIIKTKHTLFATSYRENEVSAGERSSPAAAAAAFDLHTNTDTRQRTTTNLFYYGLYGVFVRGG